MAKILFVNPVIRENDNPGHVPYGLAQLASIAVKAGHLVQVLDANAYRPTDEELFEALGADTWDVVAVGGLITSYGYIKKVVRYAREVSSEALIIAGGGFITPIPYEVMGFLPEVDIGAIGEAYLTLPEILSKVDRHENDWDAVKGIIYREAGGNLVLTEERPLLEEVDTLPFPAWHLFPLDIYFKNSSLLVSEEAMLSRRRIGVVGSYGCPLRCKYCFHLGLSGELTIKELAGRREVCITTRRKIRFHSADYLVSLVKYARERFNVDFVIFMDENFTAQAKQKKWFSRFSQLWEKEGLSPRCIQEGKEHNPASCDGIHWTTTAHAALVNEEMLREFKRLGCSALDYGFESFSDDILRSIGKRATVKQNERALMMTVKAGIRPIPNQIIGFPDETMESVISTVEAWNRLGIMSYPFFATPYPGSEWYETFKDTILEQYDNNLETFLLDLGDATKLTAVISRNFNAVELLGLRELMVSRNLKRLQEYRSIKDRQTCGSTQ
jgi:anaerobic magnesium-protoporphyrin IX monomethyl ester cyclase